MARSSRFSAPRRAPVPGVLGGPRARRTRWTASRPAAPPRPVHTVQLQGRLSSSARAHLNRLPPSAHARPAGGAGAVEAALLLFVVGVCVALALAWSGQI